MGGSRRPILILVAVLFAAGLVLTALAAGVGLWFGGGDLFPDQAKLDAREGAVRTTSLDSVRRQLGDLGEWRVVALRSEASYYSQGNVAVNLRWGLASNGDVVGPDAAPILFGAMRIIVVGQCAGTDQYTAGLAFAGSVPLAGGSPPADISYVKFASDRLPCDGHAHAIASEPFSLPAVTPNDRQWVHIFFGTNDENAASADRLAILVASPDAIYDAAAIATTAETAFGPLP